MNMLSKQEQIECEKFVEEQLKQMPYEKKVIAAKILYGLGHSAFSVEYVSGVDRKDFLNTPRLVVS